MIERMERVRKLIDNVVYYNRLGSGNIEDLEWLMEQAEKAERYEKALQFYAFEVASLNEDGTIAKRALGYSY